MAKSNQNKRRLQSLDQDVLAVGEQEQQGGRQGGGAGRQPAAGAPAATAGGGGSSTGMVVTVSIVSVLLVFTIAAGVLYGFYMHEQMKGLGGGPDLDKALAPVEERISRLEDKVANLGKADDGGNVSAEMLNRLDAVERQLSQLSSDLDAVQGKVSQAAQDSQNALNTAQQAQSAVGNLEGTVSSHGKRLDQLSSKIAKLGNQSSGEGLASQVQHLNGRVEKLSDDIDSIYRILESR